MQPLIGLPVLFSRRRLLVHKSKKFPTLEIWISVYLGPDTSQGITFVASKFVVVSFLCAVDAVFKEMHVHIEALRQP